ncbi:LADA_0H04214g1_1 [Lachancea dasiensis]|uniref:LADA_0H04214g1_1 n=1 Tax=Lachancea dasiensis TaxID=1072105 RepID=A0A1G4K0N0_9SACH|nr:LADA_0H04214g1_1 [Lachancea dasiensis]
MHILIADFDDTITNKDTIATLAELPYLYKSFSVPWSHFVDTYKQGFDKFPTSERTLPLLRTADKLKGYETINSANYHNIFGPELAYQKSLRPIELNSIGELERQRAFAGIQLTQIQEFAESRTSLLRKGFLEAWKNCSELHILSVNWCQQFIESLLLAAASKASLGPFPAIQTTCNSLCVQEGLLTGQFAKTIVTGYDKADKLGQICRTCQPDSTLWYVGDSETDLLPILYPNVNGVLLLDPHENSQKFWKITNVLGLSTKNLQGYADTPGVDTLRIDCKQKGALYLVKSWKAFTKLLR